MPSLAHEWITNDQPIALFAVYRAAFEGGYLTTYSALWLRVTVYDTNITNPNPKPIRLAQSTLA